MPRAKQVTIKEIESKKPKEKPYKLAIGDGLYLLIHPNGSKYWRFKYFINGSEKWMAFGTYDEVSLARAREKRDEARRLVADEIDPAIKKREEKRLSAFKAANTFRAVAEEWYKNNLSKWTPDHAQRLWRRLELHILPKIGNRPIAEIKPLELLDVLKEVEKRGTKETTHRLLQTSSAIFRYAVLTERIENNPAPNLARALSPHAAVHYPSITAREIPEFLSRLEKVETSTLNKLAIKIIMLTFVRQGELRQAKWVDIDFEKKEWRVPPETTKMRKLHIVPLARQTASLFKKIKELTGTSELIFPSQQHRKHEIMSENTINRVIKSMGYKGKMVGHGFRSLASTTLHEMGFPTDVIERQLAHTEQNKVKAAYNHAEHLIERRRMMQHWADYLDSVAKNGTIISLRAKA